MYIKKRYTQSSQRSPFIIGFGTYSGGGVAFYLKADIKSYFASIDHDVLKKLVQKYISCEKVLILLYKIIDSYEDSNGKGIPIGNLTSQLFANLYLNELDQFVIRLLMKERPDPIPRYFRYMDDFIVLAETKTELRTIRNKISDFLSNDLGLILHPRKQLIQNISFGIDFCGYNIFKDKIILRKTTVRRFVHRFKKRIKRANKLEKRDQMFIFTTEENEMQVKVKEIKEQLQASVTSHIGFLKYSQIELEDKNFVYVNKIRLPYLPKSVPISTCHSDPELVEGEES